MKRRVFNFSHIHNIADNKLFARQKSNILYHKNNRILVNNIYLASKKKKEQYLTVSDKCKAKIHNNSWMVTNSQLAEMTVTFRIYYPEHQPVMKIL